MPDRHYTDKGLEMKKRLIVLIILFIALAPLSGCALYWSDDALIITCFKDYDLIKKTSTSNKVKGEYKPFIEVETR